MDNRHTRSSIEGHHFVTSPQNNCPFYQHLTVSRITDNSFGVQAGIQRDPVEINNYIFFFTYKILEFALVNFPEYFCLK